VTGLSDPPRRLVTPRLVLRAYRPRDAALVKEAVDASIDHLRTFMEWAWSAPEPENIVRDRLKEFRRSFDRGRDWIYGIFSPDESEMIGGCGLHRRVGPDALEIGYWIRASRVREGFAFEAAAAMTRASFERCGAIRTEIHVDPANTASIGVAEKLGFVREATLRKRLPPMPPGTERRDEVLLSLLDDEYPGSPAAQVAVAGLPTRA
jgi:RimJ/RimL family protein N-acetyltransferase